MKIESVTAAFLALLLLSAASMGSICIWAASYNCGYAARAALARVTRKDG